MKDSNTYKNISWVSPKLALGKTQTHGKGVFARSNIKKGERVIIFGGFAIGIDQLKKIKKTHSSTYNLATTTGYQVEEDVVYTPIHKSQFSIAEYLNHSCAPSCGFKGQLDLVAMRNIKKGEQISFDYAMGVTSPILLFKTSCMCNAKTCRKHITSNDWKIPTLQKRYHGYFQPYIQEKIKKMRN